MATTTLQPGAAPANAAAHSTSRRKVLGLFAAAPLAAMPVAAATPERSSGFAEAIAIWRQRHAECEAYTNNVHRPACEAYEAACTKIPHVNIKRANGRDLSTDNKVDVAVAHACEAQVGQPYALPFTDGHRELLAAYEAREQAMEDLNRKHRASETGVECDRLTTADVLALDGVMLYPVSTIADLHQKMTIVTEAGWMDAEDVIEAIAADVRRLAGEA